ncbi:MAG: peptidoglycan bridge formation glycyltransferase FemA/FemB family protein [Patescibacteria group bacterium]|nr:peptidoglycan bridge formation glycyltransferase FemA/FemB family protein [Patescibacteria group bacterium]
MNIIEIKDKNKYNNFIKQQKHSQFLQSWEWGEFQKNAGNKVLRLGVKDDGKLLFAISLIKKSLPFGVNYFYAPRGSILNYPPKADKPRVGEFLFKEVKKIAKKEKCIFLRFDPVNQLHPSSEYKQITNYTRQASTSKLRIVKTIDVQPSKTLILDIFKSEDELLKQMHQKTRYNIRLAARKGVEIKVIKDVDKYFEEFWKLMAQTEKRDGFRLHNKSYYYKMLKFDKKFIKLIAVFYKNKMLCANIVSFFGRLSAYVHGASSNENRNLMAPYALQWHSIKLAKEYNFKYYDFNGIDKQKWSGITRFKKGFGGEEINYFGTYDLVFNSCKYNLYKILRWVRRKI